MRAEGMRAFVAHPHHYIVALGLSVAMLYFGHHEAGEHLATWIYAVLENISTIGEE